MPVLTKAIMTDETGKEIVNALLQTDVVQQRTAEINANANEILQNVLSQIPESYTEVLDKVNKALVFVTPEQFGAKGDGIADDTNALKQAVASKKPIFASGKYKVTDEIRIEGGCYIFGGGTIYKPNTDAITRTFILLGYNDFYIRDINFISERENSHVHAPTGHTRAAGSLSSNIIGISVASANHVLIDNCSSDSLEYFVKRDKFSYDSDQRVNEIKINGGNHTNYSMMFQGGDYETTEIKNVYAVPYALLGSGDHWIYGDYNAKNTIVKDCRIDNLAKGSTILEIHVFSSYKVSDGYPKPGNLTVENCTMNCNSFSAFNGTGTAIFRNCTFSNPYASSETAMYNYGNTTFENCKFVNHNNIYLKGSVKNIFRSCYFDKSRTIPDENFTADTYTEYDRCTFNFEAANTFLYLSRSNIDDCPTFTDCTIKWNNADGIFSIRHPEIAINLINCNLINSHANHFLNYDATDGGTYNIYNSGGNVVVRTGQYASATVNITNPLQPV